MTSGARLSRRVRGFRKCLAILIALLVITMFSTVSFLRCSTEVANKQIQELCKLYSRGEIAGNLCHQLCQQQKFHVSHCAGVSWGKKVNIMTCDDCELQHVVLKNKLDMKIWTRDIVVFKPNEAPLSMVNRSTEFLYRLFRSEFKLDMPSHKDLLSFTWGQNVTEFIESRTCVNNKGCQKRHTLAALKSILALSTQDEYISMILNTDSYMPALHGTCGPAYMVEYTPSLILSGYVLYQGKPDEIFRWPKAVPWRNRAKVALELIDALYKLENFKPPVFMCDLDAHNFAVDSRGHLRLLDVDSLEYERIVPDDRVCHSDSQCGYITCRGECNLTSNTCSGYPINNHLQVACRNILLSYIPAFGLLRGPPAAIAEQLQQLLTECSFPVSRHVSQQPWKSNDTLRWKMKSLLQESLLM